MAATIQCANRQRRNRFEKSSGICVFIDSNKREYKAALVRLTTKTVVRKRSFEDIEDTYKKNEMDLQRFFKAFRYHLAHHSSIRVKQDPQEMIIKKEDENRVNFQNDANADKFIQQMIEKAQSREIERRSAMDNYKNEISILNGQKDQLSLKESTKEKSTMKAKTHRDYNEGPYKMSNKSSSKNMFGLRTIKESEADSMAISRRSSVFGMRRQSIIKNRADHSRRDSVSFRPRAKKDNGLNFEDEDEDIDLILNTLRGVLDELYNDRQFLKNLYRHGDLCSVPKEPVSSEALSQHIERLKSSADQLYAKFYRTRKYVKMVRNKVDGYRVTKMMAGLIHNQMPVVESVPVFRFKEADDEGNFYDVEDLHRLAEKDTKWSDPEFPVEEWASKMPKFKKGFNSKFSRINMKDINPAEKKLDDYFNRKQVMACTARGIITQPVKDIINGQTEQLNLKEEKKPSSMYCIFDQQGIDTFI